MQATINLSEREKELQALLAISEGKAHLESLAGATVLPQAGPSLR